MVRLALAAALAASGVTFPHGTATIRTGRRVVSLRVEIAANDPQRAQGLMNRRTLAPNAGMVFLFPRPTRAQFWMKDTLIPLSIGFYDGRGRILRILDMAPCPADPCPVYDPGVSYRGALEVNRGAFRRLGVRRGSVLTLRRPSRA
jgi:uncharacterized membrane protein (UPF0127 family)